MNKLMMMAMVAAMAVAGPAWAATSIGYSGQLLDATGQKLPDGQRNVTVTFKLYGGPSDIVPLWQVERAVLLNADGYFSVELEDEENTLETVLGRSTLYLGLTPKGANEIQPRQKILPNPRAVVAERGVNDFKVEGTATITTVKAETVQQKYNGNYCDLLPKGVIVMWNGASDKIPNGWALCNGQNGTPDLRGRFVVGYDPNDGDYNVVGKKEGAKKVTLAAANLPPHRHKYSAFAAPKGLPWSLKSSLEGSLAYDYGNFSLGDNNLYTGDTTTNEGNVNNIKVINSAAAFDVRPPYYAICYIIKL